MKKLLAIIMVLGLSACSPFDRSNIIIYNEEQRYTREDIDIVGYNYLSLTLTQINEGELRKIVYQEYGIDNTIIYTKPITVYALYNGELTILNRLEYMKLLY